MKIEYPFHAGSKRDGCEIPSNTVEVRIKEPVGVDAKVWERIQSEKRLYFLQTGFPMWEDKETHRNMLEVLKQFPTSGYRDAMLYALRKYFSHNQVGPKSLGDVKQIRELLDLKLPVFVPPDPRLDVKVVLDHPPSVSIGAEFDSYAKQSGIQLSLPPFIRRKTENGTRRTAVLREEMEGIGKLFDTPWLRRDDGYFLPALEGKNYFAPVPDAEDEQTNP